MKYDIITRILEEGKKEGSVKNADAGEMTTFFFSSINGLALNKAVYGRNFKMPDKKIFIRMFLKEV